ncbi:MAG: helix-turn-helix transcriptional regulator [Rhodoglobus sp.]
MSPRAAALPSKTQFAREIGVRLQRLRIARGLSQERLAHLAGISTYTYQKFEKGESKPDTPMNPRLFTILALAQALDVVLEEILPADWPDLTAGR